MTIRAMRVRSRSSGWAVAALALSACAAPPAAAQEGQGPGGDGPFVRLQAEDRAAGDHFACALDLAGDGLGTPGGVTLLAGSLRDDDLGAQSGSAYVFEPDAAGSGLVQTAKLLAPDGGAGDLLGFSVALSRDGGRALAGAPGAPAGGAAYLFERARGGAWRLAVRLASAAGSQGGGGALGSAVVFSGELPVAGAPGAAGGRGAVVLFGAGGGELQILQPADLAGGDGFGWALAADGGRLAVGAPWSDAPFTDAGVVHLFEGGPGGLARTLRVSAPSSGPFESFGYSVALSGDLLAVGAPRSDAAGGRSAAGAGSVYLFRLAGGAAVLEARLDGAASGDQFGTSLSLTGGASPLLAVGVRRAGGSDVGAVDLFRRQGGRWAAAGRLQPADARAGDELGIDVALAPAGVAIGAYLDDGGGVDAGAVYVRVLRVAPATADLALEKSSSAPRPTPAGSEVEYRLRVLNRGPADAPGARVRDPLPAGLSGATWTCRASGGGRCSSAGTGAIDDLVDLPAGAEALYVLAARIDPGATGEVVNRASVEPPAGLPDPTPGDRTGVVRLPLVCRADLAVELDALPRPGGGSFAVPGRSLVHTLAISDQGPSDGGTIPFTTGKLPAALVGSTWTCTASGGAACAPAAGSGPIVSSLTLPAGGRVLFRIRSGVAPSATGSIAFAAGLVPSSARPCPDPVPANDAARVVTPLAPLSDLAASFGAESGPLPAPLGALPRAAAPGVLRLHPGETASEGIRFVNHGPSDVAGASVRADLAAGLEAVAWTCASQTGGTCSASGAGRLADTVDLPAGSGVTYELEVRALAGYLGRQQVAAEVAPPALGVDVEPSNNRAVRPGPLLLPAAGDLGLTKAVSGTFVEGGAVRYELVVASARGADLADGPGHELVDVLPAAVEALDAVADQGLAAIETGPGGVQTVVWDGALAAGDFVTITVEGRIRPGTRGTTVSNQAALAFEDGALELSSAPPGFPEPAPTLFVVSGPLEVPAISPFGLAALALLVAATALGLLRRVS